MVTIISAVTIERRSLDVIERRIREKSDFYLRLYLIFFGRSCQCNPFTTNHQDRSLTQE